MAENLSQSENEANSQAIPENPNPKISFITLGVNNLETMTRFYQQTLGWQLEKEQKGVRFFKMAGGTVFALFGVEALAKDIGLTSEQVADHGSSFKKMSLALNYNSIAKVDAFFAFLKEQGVYIQKAPHTVFWGGYSGYFRDPEHNYWEVAYNPFL